MPPRTAAPPAEPVDEALQAVPTHTLIWGESGTGKSTGAATWPKPMLVWSFDPRGKDTPYLKRGVFGDLEPDDLGTPCRRIYSKKTGALLIQVEHYLDDIIDYEDGGRVTEKPSAYKSFLARMHRFVHEYDDWRTVVLDSVTYAELAARKMYQYDLNPSAKDPRQWYGGSKERLEEMLLIRFASLPMNVIVLSHVDIDKDEITGQIFRAPKAVGALGRALPSAYGEVYRAYVARQQNDNVYLWQTRADAQWSAMSQVGAPDPCKQEWKAIWGAAA